MRTIKTMVFLFSIFMSGASLADRAIKSIVVFGDSLSDTGLLHQISLGTIPKFPYYEGRFSNGPVWVEYLANSMEMNDKIMNYAIGGATTNSNIGIDLPYFSFNKEVEAFLLAHAFDTKGARLYVLWIGANDYWEDRTSENVTKSIDEIIDSMENLVDEGAQYFLIPTVAAAGSTPFAKGQGIEGELNDTIAQHNAALHDRVNILRDQHPDVLFVEFDAAGLMNKIAKGEVPESGITNSTDVCYSGNYDGEGGEIVIPGLHSSYYSALSAKESRMNPSLEGVVQRSVPLKVAVDVSKQVSKEMTLKGKLTARSDEVVYHCPGNFFFDSVHPTTTVHQVLGEEAARVLKDLDFHKE